MKRILEIALPSAALAYIAVLLVSATVQIGKNPDLLQQPHPRIVGRPV